MTTVVVEFALPANLSHEQVHDAFVAAAPRFQQPPGLIRKYFLQGADPAVGGGVYLWRSRAEAEAFYGDDFHQHIRERFGVEPSVRFYDTSVIVDNRTGEIEHAV